MSSGVRAHMYGQYTAAPNHPERQNTRASELGCLGAVKFGQ